MRAISILIFVAFILLGCSNGANETAENTYISDVGTLAQRYNTARDKVDATIKSLDTAATLQQGLDASSTGVADLTSAISKMNAVYKEFGNREVPAKYTNHQRHTLSAWRAGIEGTNTVKLYIEKFLDTRESDDLLVVAANRLFAEEDDFQLQARNALINND